MLYFENLSSTLCFFCETLVFFFKDRYPILFILGNAWSSLAGENMALGHMKGSPYSAEATRAAYARTITDEQAMTTV